MTEPQKIEPGELDCPRGGHHDFERRVRQHPNLPDKRQDAMFCRKCEGVLYPWRTIKGSRTQQHG